MSITLESFLPYVIPHVIGCPEPLAIQALRRACIEFCRRTDIVQRIQAPMDATVDTQEYAVTIPADMDMCRVLGVAWNQYWLVPVPPEQAKSGPLLRGADLGTAEALTGPPKFYHLKTPDATSVCVYPLPDSTYAASLLIQASFRPTLSALSVDDSLFDDWLDGVAAGAIYRLKSMPGQPFSADPSADRGDFERAVGEAKRNRVFGRQVSMARVAPRGFV